VTDVTVTGGRVVVTVRASIAAAARTSQDIAHLVRQVPGVLDVRVNIEHTG
jgi:type III secretory pathway lipoprotein EscJ